MSQPSAMDPTLQIDAERCVLVLGSQLAAAALALSEGVPAALSYAMVVEIGMQKMLELDGIEKLEERARKQSLMLNAYELEPSFAASKVVDSLREHGIYKKWLEELFGSLLSLPVQRHQVAVVETLRSLQEKGVLLVYTYYDTILDAALKTSPVFLNDEAAVRSWASRQTPGLLHVHGVYTHPDSVRCDCVDYRQLVGESCGAPLLREVCRNRNVVFLGFDGEFFDPFLFKFSRAFLSPSQPPPLLLSLAPKLPSLDIFLTLKIPQLSNLDRVFISSAPVPRLGEWVWFVLMALGGTGMGVTIAMVCVNPESQWPCLHDLLSCPLLCWKWPLSKGKQVLVMWLSLWEVIR